MSYKPPTVTVDLVLFSFDKEMDLNVLLIKRLNDPYKDTSALPGGYVGEGETTFDALKKKIATKTSVDITKLKYIEQLYTFDAVSRDPRGHAVSITWYGLCEQTDFKNLSGENPSWIKVKDVPPLSFDHNEIIDLALSRLKDKIWYSNVIFSLVPETFSLDEIKTMYTRLDTETTNEDAESFLHASDVIKQNQDGSYSMKINELVYYKK